MSASRAVLTWDQVRGERLRRSGLVDPAPAGAEVEVAHRVCGIHAQVPSAAALSLARRVRAGTLAAYETALYEQRCLVKTYGPGAPCTSFRPRSWACGPRPPGPIRR